MKRPFATLCVLATSALTSTMAGAAGAKTTGSNTARWHADARSTRFALERSGTSRRSPAKRTMVSATAAPSRG